MAWIKVPSWANGTEFMQSLFARFKEPDGSMDRILSIHGLHPKGLEVHHALYREIMFAPGPLSRADRELAAVVVSAVNACHY